MEDAVEEEGAAAAAVVAERESGAGRAERKGTTFRNPFSFPSPV